jgi:hypothetical protein
MGVAAAYLFLLVYSIGVDVAGVVFYSGEHFTLPPTSQVLILCLCQNSFPIISEQKGFPYPLRSSH